MSTPIFEPAAPQRGLVAPLRTSLFRRIWLASLLSNLGFMFLSVGSGWAMTLLTTKADMVALVQTALMLPMMLLSIPSGAAADMYDRRKVGLVSLCFSFICAAALAALAFLAMLSPWLILSFCFLIGSGMALFNPAWQASVGEQVALNSISFNIARSFGPAVGGVIVAVAGAAAAFASTALGYLPLIVVMLLWRREPLPSRLPPERIDRAVGVGIRYVFHAPPIRIVLTRTLAMGVAGGSVSALMPLVARDLLGGTAEIFGLMLGCFGVGAIIGALGLPKARQRLSEERSTSLSALVMAAAIAVVALSRFAPLTGLALVIAGAGWMISLTLFNVLIQTSAPRWVSGRLLAAYQTAIAGGVAAGSWFWGQVAESYDVAYALLASAAALAATTLLGLLFRMPSIPDADHEPVILSDPEVNLGLTGRSGLFVVELEYRIPTSSAREFYSKMLELRSIRHRNGGFAWSISRDIKDAEIWVERFHCPTWHDYLRQRARNTPDEMRVHDEARDFIKAGSDIQVRRLLERPFGSVRWKENAPDTGGISIG